jgi:hypothetical protein
MAEAVRMLKGTARCGVGKSQLHCLQRDFNRAQMQEVHSFNGPRYENDEFHTMHVTAKS